MTPVTLRHLRDVRLSKGLSQSELARRSGVAQSVISRHEAGKFETVNLEQLWRLAEGLGVHARELFAHPEMEGRKKTKRR